MKKPKPKGRKPKKKATQPESEVARKLAADPSLRARAKALADSCREDDDDFRAMRNSTRLTGADMATRINVRSDDDL